jgi:hypothetical protein
MIRGCDKSTFLPKSLNESIIVHIAVFTVVNLLISISTRLLLIESSASSLFYHDEQRLLLAAYLSLALSRPAMRVGKLGLM